MKDKANELLEKCEIFKGYCIDAEVINAVLKFGHYVVEEQKKQCVDDVDFVKNTPYRGGDAEIDLNSILNSKNVCEQ